MKLGALILLTSSCVGEAFTQLYRRSRYPISFSSNDDEEFRQALEIARQYDAEWLAKTLDYNSLYNSSRLFMNNGPLHSTATNEALTNEESLLLALGYSREDIVTIKPSARTILISKKIRKPRSGVPDDWRSAAYLSSREYRQRSQSENEYVQPKSAAANRPRKAVADEEGFGQGGVQRGRLELDEDMDTMEVSRVIVQSNALGFDCELRSSMRILRVSGPTRRSSRTCFSTRANGESI